MKNTFLLTLLFAFWTMSLQAFSNFTFKKYQVEDGLSHNTVWCALQDSYGFVWMGTSDGLNCFDGQNYKIYRNVLNDVYSLGNNFVLTLYEEENHNIWVGTSSGLYIYHRESDNFAYFDKSTSYGVFISSEVKKVMKLKNGLVWIATLGQGLFIYNPETDVLEQNSLHTSFIWDFCESNSRIYTSSMSDGMLCFDSEGHYLHSFSLSATGGSDNYCIHSLLSFSGGIWFGAGNNLLYCLDEHTGKLSCYQSVFHNMGAIHSLLHYSETNLLLGTDNGLYFFNLNDKSFERIDNPDDLRGLSDQSVNAMMMDVEGGIWILTSLGGANYLAKQNKHFDYYSPVSREGGVYAGKVIGPFCEDADGNIWVGTRNGLCFFHTATRRLVDYAFEGYSKKYDIRSLLYENGKLWIGTYGEGLKVLDIATGRLKSYNYQKDIPNTICSDDVVSLYKDRKGNIYVGTNWGVCRYNACSDNFSTLTVIGSMVAVVDIMEDSHDNLWFATFNNGVFRYDERNNLWKHYMHDVSDTVSIISNSVITLFEDRDGGVWFGTNGGGLCSFDVRTETFTNFDPANNVLPNKVIYSIEQDGAGVFWISGNTGLVMIDPATKQRFRQFTVDDGLQGSQFTAHSSLKASDGRLYFGGINGFNSFMPDRFTDNSYTPPVYITDIHLPYNMGERTVGEILRQKKPLYLSGTVTLPYECNSFSIRFVALSYENPMKNSYSYRLKGVDKDWVVNSDMNVASYTNLAPGKYEFEVLGSNCDQKWNKQPASLWIVITPPWWLSLWAYCLYAMGIAGWVYYVAWWWNKRMKAKYKRRMEEYQMLKEKEMYKSKVGFFVNLVHEIRTPLSLIRLPLEKLLDEKKKEEDGKYLQMIDRNVNYLLDITNQLLDFQKMESNGIQLKPKRCNVNLLLQSVYDQFVGAAELRALSMSIYMPQNDVFAFIDDENVCKIIVNLISNALKYAHSRIDVRLLKTRDGFSIHVEDDGPGVPDAEKEKVFEAFYQVEQKKAGVTGTGIGLAFSKALAEAHHGSLSLSDSAYAGSAFVLSLPIGEQKMLQSVPEVITSTADSEKKEETTEYSGRNFTVLLVEDNVELLDMTGEALSAWFKVLHAQNGYQALDILARETVDVLVSDVMMPEMDGMELTAKVKSTLDYSHIPVILLTAKNTLEAKEEGMDRGADAYMEKPFTIRQLRYQIENLLKLRNSFHRMMTTLSENVPLSLENFVFSQKDCEFISRVQEAIDERISDENLSIDILSEALNMSRSAFYRKIKALTDMTPNDYLKSVRLKKSTVLLKEGMRISEVCERVGFNSASYFAKCFKMQFGMSPREYVEGKTAKSEETV